jgi:pimeloyl-ACP methyl ester carboxylesterase
MRTGTVNKHRYVHLTRYALVFASAIFVQVYPLSAEEVRIEHQNLTLNANLETAEDNGVGAQVILILHGLLGHNRGEIVRTFQEGFKKNGWASLAPNLSLGLNDRHGNYDCAIPHRHRLIDAVDELGAWLAWLKARGADRVIVIGHSLAANQVMAFAVGRGDPAISAIILLAPSTQSYVRVISIFETRYKRKLSGLLDRARRLVANGKGNTLIKNADFTFCPKATVSAAAFLDYYGDNPIRDLPAMLPKVEKPVLVIAASKDDRQPDLIERVSPFVNGPNVRLAVVDGAGHFFRDLFDDKALEYAIDFIKKLRK